MKSLQRICLAAFVLALFSVQTSLQAAPEQTLKLEEVIGLVRANLPELTEAELSRTAALGLLQQLGAKVQLVSTNLTPETVQTGPVLRASLVSQNFGYFRVEQVAEKLPGEIQRRWDALSASNRLKGAIVDLRYAKGGDYKSAAETANLFVQSERLLIRAGEAEHRSTATGEKISKPVAVLINSQTSAAAEALAAALRDAGAALLIGSATAGEARLFKTFELSTGQSLRIGTLPVEVGGQPMPAAGVVPDISVQVSAADERAYYQDPHLNPARLEGGRGTNDLAQGGATRVRRFNEAELVRRHRDGLDIGAAEEVAFAPSGKVISDPVLARAVDFLKGVSALRLTIPN